MKRLSSKEAQLLGSVIFIVVIGFIALLNMGETNDVTKNSEALFDVKERFPIDLNTATVEILQLLPGIGETRAKAIVAFRESNGGFSSTEELLQVKGIGNSTYEKLKDLVTITNAAKSKAENTRDTRLDLNTASKVDLTALPGIGEVKAAEIVKYREEHGGFKAIDELINVKGIGRATLDKIRNLVRVGSVSTNVPDKSENSGKINVNTATLQELVALPGIGPVLAERIIDYREHNGKFHKPEDLLKVSGIGIKTLSKFREMIDF